ncbi:hypothetical protein D3C78_1779220 [compost metagenome]
MLDHCPRQPGPLATLAAPLDLVGQQANRTADLMHGQAPLVALDRDHILQAFAEILTVALGHHPACRIQYLQVAGLARQYAKEPVRLAE